MSNGLANAIRFVTDDGEYISRRNDFRGCRYYVCQERFSADLVQDFGVFRFQARPFAGRHNYNSDTRNAMWAAALGLWHSIQYIARVSSAASRPAAAYGKTPSG
jgi:hypothetical protein